MMLQGDKQGEPWLPVAINMYLEPEKLVVIAGQHALVGWWAHISCLRSAGRPQDHFTIGFYILIPILWQVYLNLMNQHDYKDISSFVLLWQQQKMIGLSNTGMKLEQKAFIITIQLQSEYH